VSPVRELDKKNQRPGWTLGFSLPARRTYRQADGGGARGRSGADEASRHDPGNRTSQSMSGPIHNLKLAFPTWLIALRPAQAFLVIFFPLHRGASPFFSPPSAWAQAVRSLRLRPDFFTP